MGAVKRAVVVGAGPVGLVCAHALSERGVDVVVVDPDPGPRPDGSWQRHGVMQFLHPHFFRHHVPNLLEQLVPTMRAAVVTDGGVVNPAPEGLPPQAATLSCRRLTFERALRRAAVGERLSFLTGRAESVVVEGDRVTGVLVDGGRLDADLVIAASGRTGGFADELRPPGEGGSCGQSYVSRMYRARPGAEPLASWNPLGAQYDGYLTIAFPQDAGTHSVLFVRASADPALEALWRTPAFDVAAPLVPNLAPWTDPDRFEPITDVMRGGTLTNTYRGQGTPPAGLYFVGDAVCTTNPSAGRGVTLGLQQVAALLAALDDHGNGKDASAAFDAWCTGNVRPWYDDHVRDDDYLVRRYAGEELDPEGPIPSDVIGSAVEDDPSLAPVVMPYLGMMTLPGSLAAVEPRVREMLRDGWRPRVSEGPSKDDLVQALAGLPA